MTEKLFESASALLEDVAARAGRAGHPVRLLAATKTVEPERIRVAAAAGIRLLGENRVQELLAKYGQYPEGCALHFIGTLQTNKVKQIIDKVDMIESVDSLRLAQEIDKCAARLGKPMDILVEVNIAREPEKSGVFPENLEALLTQLARLAYVRVRGLMTIGPARADEAEKSAYFHKMQEKRIDIQNKKIHNIDMSVLSMGMSADYPLAIEAGADIVRVGSGLFGARV